MEQAKAFREKLIASGALDRPGVTVKIGPSVARRPAGSLPFIERPRGLDTGPFVCSVFV